MIIAVVQFNLPEGVDRAKALEIFQAVAPKFKGMPGLIRKNFLFNDEIGTGGGVYLWQDRETAEKVYAEGGAWREAIRSNYGVDPTITYYDSPVQVDNDAGEIRVDG